MRWSAALLVAAILCLMIGFIVGCGKKGGEEAGTTGPAAGGGAKAGAGPAKAGGPKMGGPPGMGPGGPGGMGPGGPMMGPMMGGGPGGPGGKGGPMMGMPGGPGGGPPKAAAAKPAAGGDAQSLAKEALNLKHAGDYDAAAEKARAAIAADDSNELAHWTLAWILAEQGTTNNDQAKIDEAKKEFQRVLELTKDAKKKSEAEKALKRLGD